MGHQYGWVTGLLSRPAQQQPPVGEPVHGANLKYLRVQGGKQRNQLFKFSVVLQRMVIVGNGFAAHKLSKGVHSSVPVEGEGLIGDFRLLFGGKTDSTDGGDRDKQEKSGKNQITDHL